MPALCDVNLLLALATDRHEHHAVAASWFAGIGTGEAIVCRIAQTGLLRLLNNPAVMGEEALDATACWALWRTLARDERIDFRTGEPPGLDAAFEGYVAGRALGPKLWTDAYIAAYARSGGFELTTFDKGFRKFPELRCRILTPAGD